MATYQCSHLAKYLTVKWVGDPFAPKFFFLIKNDIEPNFGWREQGFAGACVEAGELIW